MESETRLDFLDVIRKASGVLDHFLGNKWLSPSPPRSPAAPLATPPAVSAKQFSTIDVEAYVNTMDCEEIRSTFIESIEDILGDQDLVTDGENPAPMPASIPAQETQSSAHQLRSNQLVTVISQPIIVPTTGPYAPTARPQRMNGNQAGASSILHPFGINSQTLYTRTPSTSHSSVPMAPSNITSRKRKQDSVNLYVKKPLNAFMLYRAEQRLKIQQELKIRNSSAVNQEAGKCWKSLSAEEQAPYFERARKIRLEHTAMHPDWSVKDNYRKKDKKRKITNVSAEPTYGSVMRMFSYAPVPIHLAPSYQPQTEHAPSCYGPVPFHLAPSYQPRTEHAPSCYEPVSFQILHF